MKINDRWYDCNDDRISDDQQSSSIAQQVAKLAASKEAHQDPTPYILFYKQKTTTPLTYKKIDKTFAEQVLIKAFQLIPYNLQNTIVRWKKVIQSNTRALTVDAAKLKSIKNTDTKYKAETRYDFYKEENKAYDIAIKKIEALSKEKNWEPYFNLYLDYEKTTKQEILKSLEIQLIDSNYVAANLSIFIEDTIQEQARKELYARPETSMSLASLGSILEALSARHQTLSARS